MLNGRRIFERFVDRFFEWQNLAATVQPIRCDHQFGGSVIVSFRDRSGTEPSKDHGVNRTDASARQHRDGQLRRHRHVDADHVANTNAQLSQALGALGDFGLQFSKGERALIARLSVLNGFPFPNDRRPIAASRCHVGVDAVVAGVGLATDKPFRVWWLPIANRVKRFEPVQMFECFGLPKLVRIFASGGGQLFVLFLRRDHRFCSELGRRVKQTVFHQNVIDRSRRI